MCTISHLADKETEMHYRGSVCYLNHSLWLRHLLFPWLTSSRAFGIQCFCSDCCCISCFCRYCWSRHLNVLLIWMVFMVPVQLHSYNCGSYYFSYYIFHFVVIITIHVIYIFGIRLVIVVYNEKWYYHYFITIIATISDIVSLLLPLLLLLFFFCYFLNTFWY